MPIGLRVIIDRVRSGSGDDQDLLDEWLKLSDFLRLAIYSATLAYGRAYKLIPEKLGLTYTQYIATVSLWKEDNLTEADLTCAKRPHQKSPPGLRPDAVGVSKDAEGGGDPTQQSEHGGEGRNVSVVRGSTGS
jgi:hypothetical protein